MKGGLGSHDVESAPASFEVNIEIKCEDNLFLSRYDLDVFVDDEKVGSMDHGAVKGFDLSLVEGQHVIRVCKKGDESIDGSAEFEVLGGDASFLYEVRCTSDQVELMSVGLVNPPADSSDLLGSDQSEAIELFESAGFEAVSEREVKDLSVDERDKVNSIASISIGGVEQFSTSDDFFANQPVEIVHHQLRDINPPESSESAVGRNYQETVDLFLTAGFANATAKPVETSNEAEDGKVVRIKADSHLFGFSKDDVLWPDEKIVIEYGLYKEEERVSSSGGQQESPSSDTSSSDWDEEWAARKTFERYGKLLYPYGFKCHWNLDLVTCEPQGDGTYFIKVGVTIENAFGNKIRTYAQGVSGNGNVTDFYVSS